MRRTGESRHMRSHELSHRLLSNEQQLGRSEMPKLTDRLLYTYFTVFVIVLVFGLLLPNVIGRLDAAKLKAAAAQTNRLAIGVEAFHVDMKQPPHSLDELANSTYEYNGKTKPYVKRVILNDPWGEPYIYVLSKDQESFEIISLGADGQEGGEGINSDIKVKNEFPSR